MTRRGKARASVESIKAMRQINPRIRFFHIDPMINVIARDLTPESVAASNGCHRSQFEAYDMITGRQAPELGGQEDFVAQPMEKGKGLEWDGTIPGEAISGKTVTYRVRWVVAGRRFSDSFTTKELAESHRAKLRAAAASIIPARNGTSPFCSSSSRTAPCRS